MPVLRIRPGRKSPADDPASTLARALPRTSGHPTGEPLPPLRERLQALRLVPRFLAMVWRTRPSYGVGILVCQVISAFGPVAPLWVGKLIIDEVVISVGSPAPACFAWSRCSSASRSRSRRCGGPRLSWKTCWVTCSPTR